MAWLAMAQDTRDMARAESLVQRALDLFAQTQALETAGGAVALGTLARILEAQGKLAEAHDALEKALMIREKLFGPKDILVADSMDRLAMNYVHQGRAVEAEPMLKQAVTILRSRPRTPRLVAAVSRLRRLRNQPVALRRTRPAARRSCITVRTVRTEVRVRVAICGAVAP